ncbi:MAG: flavodoxin family protein [Bacteroidota bacterium]
MTSISIVYDSKYGSNRQIAEFVYEHLQKQKRVEVHLIRVQEVARHWKVLSQSDGMIFGCPTFLGSVSAEFKKFMESASIYFADQKWKDKLAAGFTCSGAASGDKLGTLLQLFLFAAQHGMTWVNMGLGTAGNVQDEDNPANLNRLGCWMGAMAQVRSNASATDRVPLSDLMTACHLADRMLHLLLPSEKTTPHASLENI